MVMEYAAPSPLWYRSLIHHPRGFLLDYMFKQGTVGAEIGVWQGGFSDLILHWVKPKKLHLIDPWLQAHDEEHRGSFYGPDTNIDMESAYVMVGMRFAKEIADDIVKVHRATSQEIVDQFPDEYFDWVYVDGDHAYESVKADLNLYLPKVKVGGLLAGDDYGATEEWWGDGIIRAVDEFTEEHKDRVRRFLLVSDNYVIRRIK